MNKEIALVLEHGYSLATWQIFCDDVKLPDGLLNRAIKTRKECEERGETVTHVLYDTNDNDEGFMLLGNDPETLAVECIEHLELTDE